MPSPLRRDAEVNLARILVAAHDVFAERATSASMETIAERAEVGVGTLYRRFPPRPTSSRPWSTRPRANRAIAERCWPRWRPGTRSSSSYAGASPCRAAGGRPSPRRPGDPGTGLDELAPLLDGIIWARGQPRRHRPPRRRGDRHRRGPHVGARCHRRRVRHRGDPSPLSSSSCWTGCVRGPAPPGAGEGDPTVAQLDRILRQR